MHDLFELGKKHIKETKPYQAGKPIEEVERELGLSDIVKLASNENPLGPSPKAIAAAARALIDVHLYPDALYFNLRQKLSEYTGVDLQNITLGNGSENCLECLIKAYIDEGDKVVMDQYAFATIRILVKAYGAEEVLVPSQNFRHDVHAIAASVDTHTKMVFVVNPNNPTGTYITQNELVYLLDTVSSDTIVVVDEAYFEYLDKPDYPDTIKLLDKYDNLVISRTFSKVFGIAGLRLGYLLSSFRVSELLHRARMPFNVNNCAVAAGIASLDDTEFLAKTRKANTDGLLQVSRGLEELGISYTPSVGNFIMADMKTNALDIYNDILHKGVIVRPLVPYGLPNHLRITIGTYEQNVKLLQVLKEVYHA
jgi:histidinol-phosphate aminotransferase